jgi:hypothetical protein
MGKANRPWGKLPWPKNYRLPAHLVRNHARGILAVAKNAKRNQF